MGLIRRVRLATGFYLGLLTVAVVAGAVGSLSGAALAAAPTVGAQTTGCQGQVRSYSKSGVLLGTLVAPGTPSSGDPLPVDPSGTVRYSGSTAVPIVDYTWAIDVWGIKLTGGAGPNDGRATTLAGQDQTSRYIGPHLLTGMFYVSGYMRGGGGTCEGDVWMRMLGNPVGTPGWIAGVALSVIGIAGLAFSFPAARS